MAAREHNVTRRDLLAGAAAAPSALTLGRSVTGPSVSAAGIKKWVVALSAVTRSEAALKDFAEETRGKAASSEEQWAFDEQYSDLSVELGEALVRLLCVPAPELEDFGLKVILAIDYEVATLTGGEEAMAQVKEDARRWAWYGG